MGLILIFIFLPFLTDSDKCEVGYGDNKKSEYQNVLLPGHPGFRLNDIINNPEMCVKILLNEFIKYNYESTDHNFYINDFMKDIKTYNINYNS